MFMTVRDDAEFLIRHETLSITINRIVLYVKESMPNKHPEIFISYAWNDEGLNVADDLERCLQEKLVKRL
jgi:hypothetical protein